MLLRSVQRLRGARAGAVAATTVPLVLLGVTAPPAAVSEAARPAITRGVGTNYQWSSTAADEPADLKTLVSLNVRYVREDIYWDRVQPAPNVWNWAPYDALFTRAANQGVEILPILGYGTSWASPGGDTMVLPAASSAQAAYAKFAAAVVRRYGPKGSFWTGHHLPSYRPIGAVELWNEPWLYGRPSVSAYVSLVSAATAAVRAVNPSVRTLVNVDDRYRDLADNTTQYWGAAVLRLIKARHVTVGGWAIHPYPTSAVQHRVSSVADAVAQVRWVRSLLRTGKLAGDVWVTEIGFASAPTGWEPRNTPAAAAADYTAFLRQLALLPAPNPVRRVYAFTAARPSSDTRPGGWDYGYNLFDATGVATPALRAFSRG